MNKPITKYICCSCGSEILVLDKWDEDICLSIWDDGYSCDNRLSIWQRMRWCWQIITKGKPFTDQIVLDENKIEDIMVAMEELKSEEIN